jgi:hypothetical protein
MLPRAILISCVFLNFYEPVRRDSCVSELYTHYLPILVPINLAARGVTPVVMRVADSYGLQKQASNQRWVAGL